MNKKNLTFTDNPQLIDSQDQSWLDFVASHPDATIFHHPAWIQLLGKCYGYFSFVIVVRDNNDRISCGVPFMKIRSIIRGRSYVSLPYTDHCQPLTKDDESLRKITNWLTNEYQNKTIPRIELRWDYPESEQIKKDTSYVKHTIQLNRDSELVAQKLKRTHRQNIQTAINRGVEVVWGNELDHLRRFYILQLETRRRHGIPAQPWSFFKQLSKSIFQQGLGFVLLAYNEGKCIAGIVFLHWKNNLVAKYSASLAEAMILRPNNLLFWQGIEWGCKNGFTVFDFGRTEKSNHGLCRYKRGWGAKETPLTYSTLSQKTLDNNGEFSSKLIQTVIRKSPLWVCWLTGELLYRHFG